MKRALIILLAAFFLSPVRGQLKFDSINRVIDTVKEVPAKIDRFYWAFHRKKLSSKETTNLKSELMKIATRSGEKRNVAIAHYRIAWVDYYQSKFNESIMEFFKCLKIAEDLKDSSLIGNTNTEIADAYIQIKNMAFAKRHLHYAFMFLNPEKKTDKKVLDLVYQSLSTIYRESHNTDSALYYAHKKLDYATLRKNRSHIASSYNTLALIYKEIRDYDKALNYLEMMLKIKREQNDNPGMATALVNIGNIYRKKGDVKKAITMSEEGKELAFKNNLAIQFRVALKSLAENYQEIKDYKNSTYYLDRYIKVKDSLYEFEMSKQLSELTAVYETQKKDAEIALKEEQLKTSTAENTKQRVMIVASCIALVLACIAIFFIYRSFKMNRENARELAAKNAVIEEKQKEIIDSIKYAKRIQIAHIPSEKLVGSMMERSGKK